MKIAFNHRSAKALTFIEVLIVIAVIAILSLILLPPRTISRKSKTVHCLNNLHQIGIASTIFADEHNGHYPMPLIALIYTNGATDLILNSSFNELSYTLHDLAVCVCPEDTRKPAANYTALKNENISYFLSLDADPETTNTIAAGDRNLEVSGQPVKPGLFILTRDTRISWTSDMHSKRVGEPCGNLLLTDGSARFCKRNNAVQIVKRENTATNRLMVP